MPNSICYERVSDRNIACLKVKYKQQMEPHNDQRNQVHYRMEQPNFPLNQNELCHPLPE